MITLPTTFNAFLKIQGRVRLGKDYEDSQLRDFLYLHGIENDAHLPGRFSPLKPSCPICHNVFDFQSELSDELAVKGCRTCKRKFTYIRIDTNAGVALQRRVYRYVERKTK